MQSCNATLVAPISPPVSQDHSDLACERLQTWSTSPPAIHEPLGRPSTRSSSCGLVEVVAHLRRCPCACPAKELIVRAPWLLAVRTASTRSSTNSRTWYSWLVTNVYGGWMNLFAPGGRAQRVSKLPLSGCSAFRTSSPVTTLQQLRLCEPYEAVCKSRHPYLSV